MRTPEQNSLKCSLSVVELEVVADARPDLSLIPPARLGLFVAECRRMVGLSTVEVANALSGKMSSQEVRLLEAGRLQPTELQVRALGELLHLPLERVVPLRVRLVVDPEQGQMVSGGTVATFVPHADVDELLLSYLACVTVCRHLRPGTYIAPRADDLEVLSIVLEETVSWVRQRIAVLCRQERDELRIRTRAMAHQSALPGLGLFVAFTAVGGLLLVDAESVAAMPLPFRSLGGRSSAVPTMSPPAAGTASADDETEPCVVVSLADRARSSDDT